MKFSFHCVNWTWTMNYASFSPSNLHLLTRLPSLLPAPSVSQRRCDKDMVSNFIVCLHSFSSLPLCACTAWNMHVGILVVLYVMWLYCWMARRGGESVINIFWHFKAFLLELLSCGQEVWVGISHKSTANKPTSVVQIVKWHSAWPVIENSTHVKWKNFSSWIWHILWSTEFQHVVLYSTTYE